MEEIVKDIIAQVSKLELKGGGNEILVIKSDLISGEVVQKVREYLRKQLGPDSKLAILAIDTTSEVTLLKLSDP